MLEEACWDLRRDLAFDYLLHNLSLVFAPGHEHDLLCGKHSSKAHGDGLLWSSLGVVVEVAGLTLAACVGEKHCAGVALFGGSGLVEANLTLLAYAYDEHIKIAGLCVELEAVLPNLVVRNGTVGNVDVFGEDVNIVEELLMQLEVAALALFGC